MLAGEVGPEETAIGSGHTAPAQISVRFFVPTLHRMAVWNKWAALLN